MYNLYPIGYKILIYFIAVEMSTLKYVLIASHGDVRIGPDGLLYLLSFRFGIGHSIGMHVASFEII